MNEAPLYSKNNPMQRHDALFVLKRYFELIKWRYDVDEKVLDIGCGDGNVLTDILMPFLPGSVQKVVGVDVSRGMVEFAKKYHRDEKLVFVQADVGAKDMIAKFEEKYDHIFSFFCLHWVQNQRKCVENMYDLLHPNGDMLLTFLAANPIFDVYESMARYKTWSEYMWDVEKFIAPFHHTKDPEMAYRKILKEVGFNVHICKVIDRTFVFRDVALWRKSIAAVNPFLSRIPEHMKREYEEDFFEEVKQMNYVIKNENNNEDNIEARYKLFIVYASK